MSSASRWKPNSKYFARAGKELQRVPYKPSASRRTDSGVPASADNPPSGKFLSLKTSATNSSPPRENDRVRNIDKTDEHSGSSLRTTTEYDSVSNNDSCSVESEDHKEKTTCSVHKEAIPGSDNDKRDKIRQNNERKHQRQRERRAHELHERCRGYLMSRKLEALAEQLVAMGFSSEQATMALILNEGRVEESVAWLFEVDEEATEQSNSSFGGSGGGNLKIDIAEELAQIADMVTRYKCSRQEVERAVVACEGNLEKTAETLRGNKKETSAALQEETVDPPVFNDGKLAESVILNPMRPQIKSTASVKIKQRDARNFSHPKSASIVATFSESGNKNLQSFRRTFQPMPERTKPLVVRPASTAAVTEKSCSSVGSRASVSYSLASSLQVATPPVKPEVRYVAVDNEVKKVKKGPLKEPVIVMKRPQSINSKQKSSLATSVHNVKMGASGTAGSSYPDSISGPEIMKFNGSLPPHISSSTTNLIPCSIPIQHQIYRLPQHQTFVPSYPVDYSPAAGSGEGGSWSTTGTSPSLSPLHLPVPPSMGPFPGSGSSGPFIPTSLGNWSTGGGLMPPTDYSNIDWTAEIISIPKRSPSELPLSSFVSNDRVYDLWSSATSIGMKPMLRSANPNFVGGGRLREEGIPTGALPSSASTVPSSLDWTSPFAGKDLFSIPRLFATSTSQ